MEREHNTATPTPTPAPAPTPNTNINTNPAQRVFTLEQPLFMSRRMPLLFLEGVGSSGMKDSGTYGFYFRVGSSNSKPGLDVDRDASFPVRRSLSLSPSERHSFIT
jgi:hypothetical protein